MTETFWLKADNIAAVMPTLGQAIRARIAAGESIQVAIDEQKKGKTRQQEKYAHACIGVIAKEVGENPEHLKVRIKHQLGLIEEVYSQGKVITMVRSTSDLKRDEYGDFINAIQLLAGHLNITLPQPRHYGIDEWTF